MPSQLQPLFPKEHGAYGQLGLPVLTALCLGVPTWGSVCLAVASWAAFFAHEPVALLLGKRGVRLRRTHAQRATFSLVLWGLIALLGGAAGLYFGGASVIRAALIPAGLALVLTPLLLLGWEKSLPGEMLAAAALSAASLPVTVSAGLELETALWIWLAWMSGFFASTLGVVRVIAVNKNKSARMELFLLILITSGAATRALNELILVAALPHIVAAWALVLRPPSPRHLRRVGWTLMGAGVLAAATVVIVVHRAGYA